MFHYYTQKKIVSIGPNSIFRRDYSIGATKDRIQKGLSKLSFLISGCKTISPQKRARLFYAINKV
jgi:hypothetical protein